MGIGYQGPKMSDVHNWIDAGKSYRANRYIHPSGDVSDEAYWASGRKDAQKIEQAIGDADTVLEFGCGNGRILRALDHPKAYGVDISPELIAGLNNACLVSEFNKTVDAVFSLSVLIHLTRHQAVEALQWIYEHLNEGGKAYLQIPVYDLGREPNSWIDVGTWSPLEFATLVSQVGFKIVEMHVSPGSFSYANIGPNHNEFHVLVKE